MCRSPLQRVASILLLALVPCVAGWAAAAESEPLRAPGVPVDPIGQGPHYFQTAEGVDIRVRVLARGLSHPWSMAWLPDGSMLLTEKDTGSIRRVIDGVLQPEPVPGAPDSALISRFKGLLDIALHPDFAREPWVYLSYNKQLPGDKEAIAIARGRWDGTGVRDTRDIFVGEEGTTNGVRLQFGGDGMLYVGVYVTTNEPEPHFYTNSQRGKILRLTPEGGIPQDNPFVDREGFLPEIWSYGHRTPTGITRHPQSGDLWAVEMGPNGGDELNLIQRGGNYGWPLVSLGRAYTGGWQADQFQLEGTLNPVTYWMPGISVSGLSFYTGSEFPEWQGDLFIGAMQKGQIPATGQLVRIKFDARGEEVRQESLLTELRQRIRDVKQGPDGRLYLLTDEDDGLLLRIERAE